MAQRRLSLKVSLRWVFCFDGGGGPRVGEVTKSTIHISPFIVITLHERWGTPPAQRGVGFCKYFYHVNAQCGVTHPARRRIRVSVG